MEKQQKFGLRKINKQFGSVVIGALAGVTLIFSPMVTFAEESDGIENQVLYGKQEVSEGQAIPYETIYRENPNIHESHPSRVVQHGQSGVSLTTKIYKTLNGERVELISESTKILSEPIPKIIEVPTGISSTKTETVTNSIPYETVYRENPEMAVGTEKVVQEGVKGHKTLTTEYTLFNDQVTNSRVIDEQIVDPINQIIEYGTLESNDNEGSVDRTEDVDVETHEPVRDSEQTEGDNLHNSEPSVEASEEETSSENEGEVNSEDVDEEQEDSVTSEESPDSTEETDIEINEPVHDSEQTEGDNLHNSEPSVETSEEETSSENEGEVNSEDVDEEQEDSVTLDETPDSTKETDIEINEPVHDSEQPENNLKNSDPSVEPSKDESLPANGVETNSENVDEEQEDSVTPEEIPDSTEEIDIEINEPVHDSEQFEEEQLSESSQKSVDATKDDALGTRLPDTATASWAVGLIGAVSLGLGGLTALFDRKDDK